MPAPAGISLAARGAVWAGMEGNSGQLPEQTRLYQRIAAAAGGGIRTVCETVRRRGTDGGRASGDGRDHVDARGRRGGGLRKRRVCEGGDGGGAGPESTGALSRPLSRLCYGPCHGAVTAPVTALLRPLSRLCYCPCHGSVTAPVTALLLPLSRLC